MLEESIIPSMWASMNSWFTPTVLFVLLNLVIGTIAITSSIGSQKHQHQQQQQAINRAPSLLHRLKSIDLYRYRSEIPTTTPSSPPPDPDPQPPEQQQQQQQQDEQITELNQQNQLTISDDDDDEEEEEEEEEHLAEVVPSGDDHHQVKRSKSDTKPASGEMPVKLARKMRKSASVRSAFRHFKEEEEEEEDREMMERRRPATVREGKEKKKNVMSLGNEDEEVDAKADDFINRFKHQLRLQRLDSLMRYKEMIGRGAASAAN